MKSLEGVLLNGVLAMALAAPACHSINVAPWPYTTETGDDGGAADGASDDGASLDGASLDGASLDGASLDAGDQGMTGAGGIEATYGDPVPVSCDGGLCSTDNYSLCNIADGPATGGAGLPLSLFVGVAGIGIAIARKRDRRKTRRSS